MQTQALSLPRDDKHSLLVVGSHTMRHAYRPLLKNSLPGLQIHLLVLLL